MNMFRFFSLKSSWGWGWVLLIGIFLRFYNLLWGAPYFFHPDERNVVYAISQLSFPSQMNPHFFAYGSLPIYIVFFTSTIFSFILKIPNDFSFIVFWLRFFSAFLSCLIVISTYSITKRLVNKSVGSIAAFFSLFSTGLIQFAHFGTFELWTTFFSLWLFYFSVKLSQEKTKFLIIMAALISGVLISIKVSNVVLIVFPIICMFLYYAKDIKKNIFPFLLSVFVLLLIIGAVYIGSNLYVLLDTNDFLSSMHYESSVALGSLPVFYTGSFFNTIPVVFQFFYVYPFLINPLLTIFFIPIFLFVLIKGFRQKNNSSMLVITYYLLLFIPQAILFVKWTRYMVPTLPFIYILLGIGLGYISHKYQKILLILLCIVSIIFTFAFAKTVYFSDDTRVLASRWAQNNISSDKHVLAEPYDLGILPFNPLFKEITLLPAYDIDQNIQTYETFKHDIQNGEVFISPSQRLSHSRLINKKNFPYGSEFYTNLLEEKTQFKLVYKTPCDVFCKITYMGNPLFNVEETAVVFDRPTVMVFQKE